MPQSLVYEGLRFFKLIGKRVLYLIKKYIEIHNSVKFLCYAYKKYVC